MALGEKVLATMATASAILFLAPSQLPISFLLSSIAVQEFLGCCEAVQNVFFATK